MKKLFLLIIFLSCCVLHANKVLWQEDFAKDGTLQDNGFTVMINNPKDIFTVKNKELVLTCTNAPYRGTTMQKKVQLVPKCEFSFEAAIGTLGNNNFALKLELGNMLISFRNNRWWIYSTKTKNWIFPGRIKYGVWHKYKIRLDSATRIAEYFIDDMDIPVFVDEKSDFDPTESNLLKIGNYGLTGNVTCKLRNIKYTELKQQINNSSVVFEEKFAVDGKAEDNNFNVTIKNPKDDFTVKDGVLKMVCTHAPYKGMTIQKHAVIPAECEITFDANTGMTGSSGPYNNISLKIEFGNLLMAFRNNQWWCHKPSENKWIAPAKIKSNVWNTYKIRLDANAKRAEFFVNDMTTPVFADEKSEFDPKKKYTLMIGNYGLARGTIVNAVRNIRISTLKSKNNTADKNELDGTMLFVGFDMDKYPLEKYVGKFGKGKTSKFIFLTKATNLRNSSNTYEIKPTPEFRPKALPKCIIMADMPLDAIPSYAQKQILAAINKGATLLILNGFFTLNKGNFHKTDFEKILPVTVDDPWKTPVGKKNAQNRYINNELAISSCNAGKGKVIVVMTEEGSNELLKKM